jgi:hypothetical protein
VTAETATFVMLGAEEWHSFAQVAREANAAAARHAKALPGDLLEAGRHAEACALVEERAAASTADRIVVTSTVADRMTRTIPSRSWYWAGELFPADAEDGSLARLMAHLDAGGVVVEIRNPLADGQTPALPVTRSPEPPADRWRPPTGMRGAAASKARFVEQLVSASGSTPVVPSGVPNRVLTELLHEYSSLAAGPRREVRVRYRDGSEVKAPLRLGSLRHPEEAIRFGQSTVDRSLATLRLALLSVRHPEMDGDVDGAWLRNKLVSRVRPAALTDELVYTISRVQLEELGVRERCFHIFLYQTGLEPAVMGFYRALIDHLIVKPGTVEVTPMFYSRRTRSFTAGSRWGHR